MSEREGRDENLDMAIAVIGFDARLPGARDCDEFWSNLERGVESITVFEAAPGQRGVGARGVLEDVELFDAAFFGYTPREAEIMDPQQRLFLECAWGALESAGYDPQAVPGAAGVFAGSGSSSYQAIVRANPEVCDLMGAYRIHLANAGDFLATRVSYKLNLSGPSVAVQTACSTSLVAIHMACQSLLGEECDVALAGGAAIRVPQRAGYQYQEGGIQSPDGHCRPFDARAQGTVGGAGVGVVVLKRLADALRDGDPVRALVLSSAVNNDGSRKMGFTAPSVEGQARAIAEALSMADVEPSSIAMIEAHGTATPLGDPIEVAALTQALGSDLPGASIALGSVKSNIGHCDAAAGVAGFLKATLALEKGTIPPSLHFESPNPELAMERGPFFVPTAPTPFPDDRPRRAGVSSFGIGGTNAHAILQEAPEPAPRTARPHAEQLLVLSARSEAALEQARTRLAAHLEHSNALAGDVAYTLQRGRTPFEHRIAFVAPAADPAEAVLGPALAAALASEAAKGRAKEDATVAFLLPGQGAQRAGMGAALYRAEPVFRAAIDDCARRLLPHLGSDLRTVLLTPGADEALRQTALAQPALLAVEYALSRLWESWGVRPAALLGHSVGEYAAAVLAGIFSLDDALRLVAARGAAMQALPGGVMLAVPLAEAEIRAHLTPELSLAASNAPHASVVAGPEGAIAELERVLGSAGVEGRRLVTSHAFHSAAIDPVLEALEKGARAARPSAATIPMLLGATGDWARPGEAEDPGYWARQARHPVRFADAAARLLKTEHLLLEVGPGASLGALVRQQGEAARGRTVAASLPEAGAGERAALLRAVGQLWCAGVEIDWDALHPAGSARRVPLPTYPFERLPYWVKSAAQTTPESVPMQPAEPAQEPTAAPDGRRERLGRELRELTGQLIGVEEGAVDPGAHFLALGADSLLLMQLSRAITTRYGLDVPFRSLMGDWSSVNALAAAIDAHMPPEPVVAPAPVAAPVAPPAAAPLAEAPAAAPQSAPMTQPAAAPVADLAQQPVAQPASASYAQPAVSAESYAAQTGSGLERLIAQQLDVMSQQLQLLRGGAVAPAQSYAPAAAPPVTSAASTVAGTTTTEAAPSSATATPPLAQPAAFVTTTGNGSSPAGLTNGSTPAAASNGTAPNAAAQNGGTQSATATRGAEAFGPYRPATTQRTNTLDERQQRHLNELIERHVRRTKTSRAMAESSRGPLADSRASAGFRMDTKELVYPIVGERSQGARLWDVDGNEYVDFTMGFGVHLFGHSPPFVTDALHEQIQRGLQLGPQSELAETVAAMIRDQTGMDRVAFCNTGTEAIMGALRLARAHTRRERVAIFAGSYHGGSDGVLARLDASGATVPVAPGVAVSAVSDVLVLEYGNPASLETIRQHAGELAAVLVEPIQSSRPHLQPREFLHELRRVTAEAGIALVFDEVISGFRLHPRGAQGWYGVDADIGAYGKVLGGGLPIGVVAGRRAYMDAVDGGDWKFGDASYPQVPQTFFAGTFAKNPLVMAAARAVLAEVAARGPALQEGLNRRTRAVAARLNRIFKREGAPIQVWSGGSLFRFVHAPGERWLDLLYPHLLEHGIYVWEGRACFLSTAHGDAEVDALVRAVEASVAAMREGGFLPPRPEPEAPLRVPMTAAQQGIWVHTRFGREVSLAYNEILALELEGELDEAALRSAVERLVERHDSLRMSIDPEGTHQLRHAEIDVEIPVHDLAGGDPEAAMREWFEGEVHRPLDLVRGPLFRTQLLRLGDARHVLVFTVHHIIADGAAAGVLLTELAVLYTAALTGRDAGLPPARQLSDFAVREREEEDTPRMREAEAYWRARLAGVPPLELGTGRSRPGNELSRGHRIGATLIAPVADALVKMAAARGTTLFTVLLSAYALVLNRLTGQDDFLVGAPTDQRTPDTDRALVAHAVDLLPVRCRVDPAMSYTDFLRELTGHWHDALDNRQFTMGRWNLAAGADDDGPPRITTAINLEPPLRAARQGGAPAAGGVRMRVLAPPVLYAKLDINFDVARRTDGLSITCTYNTNLLDEGTADRVLQMLGQALVEVAEHPDARIAELDLAPPGERERTLVEWNATAADFPRDLCLHQLASEQARRAPDAPALLWGDEAMSYAEVERRANQLAHHLRRRGVGPESRVALCLGRTPEMVIAILAVLRAGGAYVPLDPAYPRDRLAFMLDDSGATLLLASERFLDAIPAEGVEVVALESVRDAVAVEREDDPGVAVDPANLAYVIYTSGSTGRPKGIALAHRGVVNNLTDLNRRFRVGADDRLLFLSSLSFDMSVYEVLGTLAAGAALVIPDAAAERDPAHWVALARRHGVSVWNSAPALLQALVGAVEDEEGALSSIRLAFLGGDWVPVDLPARLRAMAPDAEVVVMGGATEASIHSTIFVAGDADPAWRSIPYGHPMANQRVYVLSPQLEPLPIHAPGELYLGGVGLARGYLDRPGATAERFVPSPFGDGERIYRTGDRARWRADGELELLGRLDHQIKVRGFRIEAGEVESVLREHPSVRSAVVMAHGDGDDRFLAAYVVAHPGATPDGDALRDFARGRLPVYMVPAAVVVLERLPLSPNGKVDRAALPIPRPGGSAAAPEGPMSATEEALATIWSEVLRVPVRGPEDDFFDLGGHSLLAARVASRVGQRFGVELSLADLFQLPTVRALAGLVDERAAAAAPPPPPADPGSMAQLLTELEAMSDAEVRALLEATGGA